MSNDKNFLTIIGSLIGMIILLACLVLPGILINAFVFIKLWGWFIVPFLSPCISHVPFPSYPVAVGIFLLANILRYRGKDILKEPLVMIGHDVLCSLLVFIVGWVVSLFVWGEGRGLCKEKEEVMGNENVARREKRKKREREEKRERRVIHWTFSK